MTYKQAKQIVLRAYPTAILAALRTVRKRIQKWSGGDGENHKLETESIQHDYYILGVGGRDLCNGFRSKTKAPAWIKAAEELSYVPKNTPEVKIKQYPLYQADLKRERTKQKLMANGRKKWYYRGIGYKKTTDSKLEVS